MKSFYTRANPVLPKSESYQSTARLGLRPRCRPTEAGRWSCTPSRWCPAPPGSSWRRARTATEKDAKTISTSQQLVPPGVTTLRNYLKKLHVGLRFLPVMCFGIMKWELKAGNDFAFKFTIFQLQVRKARWTPPLLCLALSTARYAMVCVWKQRNISTRKVAQCCLQDLFRVIKSKTSWVMSSVMCSCISCSINRAAILHRGRKSCVGFWSKNQCSMYWNLEPVTRSRSCWGHSGCRSEKQGGLVDCCC